MLSKCSLSCPIAAIQRWHCSVREYCMYPRGDGTVQWQLLLPPPTDRNPSCQSLEGAEGEPVWGQWLCRSAFVLHLPSPYQKQHKMQSKVCKRKGNSLLCHLWLFKTILLNKKSCSMTSPSAGKREYYVAGMRKMEALCDGKSSAVCSSHFVRKCTMLVYEFEKKKIHFSSLSR